MGRRHYVSMERHHDIPIRRREETHTKLIRNNNQQKLIRNNNQPFMTKTLRKAIMKRSKLRNKFNKERNIENWSEYKRQRNLVQIF